MTLYEKSTTKEYCKIELLFPTIKLNKKIESVFRFTKTTELDLSTKFMLTETNNSVTIVIRLLGFGLSVYYGWR